MYPGVRVPNHGLLYLDLNRVQCAVDEEVAAGRYVMLPPSVDPRFLNISAMGVAPRFKSFRTRRDFEQFARRLRQRLKRAALDDDFEGRPVDVGPGLEALGDLKAGVKWRVIHDLSHPLGSNVNSFVESPYFKLPLLMNFARRVTRGGYIWKADIEKAFRNVPVRRRDWPLLAFYVNGVLYVDTRLPFGHALSPFYFVSVVGRPILYVAVRRGATLLGALAGYVDDFFGAADTYDKAVEQMQIWLQVCADLGVPVSKAKTFLPAQVVEVLGFIIDTVSMTVSVDSERLDDILLELQRVEDRRTVHGKDLESLAGKMVHVCSVVAGGRTFMREVLDMVARLRSPHHWVHLTEGFRADLRWWIRFARAWNGVEAIPPPVTVPYHWLCSDASGDHGLGLFVCGAGVHVPLPLSRLDSSDAPGAERELIIAETELIAAVLAVALAAPLFPGEHLLIGIDNTNAISWIDRGTARRPRAMRCLRILWRIQAIYRVHVSTRFIPSEQNQLADAASRCDAFRFFRAARPWLASHAADIRQYGVETGGRASLVTAAYGAAGGAVGVLAQLLCEGHAVRLEEQEDQVARLLQTVQSLAPRLVAQCADRLRHVAGDGRQEGQANVFQFDRALHRLLGSGRVLCSTQRSEPGGAPRGEAVPAGCGQDAGQGRYQGGAVYVGPAASPERSCHPCAQQPVAADGRADCERSILRVPPGRSTDSQAGRAPALPADAWRSRGRRPDPSHHGASLQDHPLPRTSALGRDPGTGRPALVPLGSIDPLDLELATPVLPDAVVRAVFDRSHTAVAFQVPRVRQPHCSTALSPDAALLPSGLREAGPSARSPDLASDAPWRLADARGGDGVRRGCLDTEPVGGRVKAVAFAASAPVQGGSRTPTGVSSGLESDAAISAPQREAPQELRGGARLINPKFEKVKVLWQDDLLSSVKLTDENFGFRAAARGPRAKDRDAVLQAPDSSGHRATSTLFSAHHIPPCIYS